MAINSSFTDVKKAHRTVAGFKVYRHSRYRLHKHHPGFGIRASTGTPNLVSWKKYRYKKIYALIEGRKSNQPPRYGGWN